MGVFVPAIFSKQTGFHPKVVEAFKDWASSNKVDLENLKEPAHVEEVDAVFKPEYLERLEQAQIETEQPSLSPETEITVLTAEQEADDESNSIRQASNSNIPQIPADIKVVNVDDLYRYGDGDDLISREVSPKEKETVEKDPEFRWHMVLNILGDLGIKNNEITAYRMNDTYLIDINNDRTRAQILVEDYHAVFVIRDPDFSIDKLPLHRSESDELRKAKDRGELDDDTLYLLDRRDTWMFSKHNDEQFRKDLETYVLTPADKLETQVKRKVAWANKGSFLVHTFMAEVMRHGVVPKTNDQRTVFEVGKLAKLCSATPSRMYAALRSGGFDSLSAAGVNTLNTLFNHCAEKYPLFRTFRNTSPLDPYELVSDIRKVYRDFPDILADIGNSKTFAELDIYFCDKTMEQINLALEYEALPELAEILNLPTPPKTWAELVYEVTKDVELAKAPVSKVA